MELFKNKDGQVIVRWNNFILEMFIFLRIAT